MLFMVSSPLIDDDQMIAMLPDSMPPGDRVNELDSSKLALRVEYIYKKEN
jgi:hypothetical protein